MNHRALSWEIWESSNFKTPGLRLPRNLELDDSIIDVVKNLNWRDLDWEDIGSDGRSIIWLNLKLPIDLDITEGVIVDIQLIQNTFYQIHISLSESLRGIGLGTKIYRSIIDWAGHLYSGKGRRLNPIVDNVWDGLKSEPGVICLDNKHATICISELNPDIDRLTSIFNQSL